MRLDTDPFLDRYAARVEGLAASEIRALFAVASRPEIVSFAGGMPDISVLDLEAVEDVVARVIREQGATALQYGGGQGREALREVLVELMAAENVPAHVDDLLVTVGGQQALELIAKCFIDPGDVVLAEGPTYVGALAAFSSHQADVRHVTMDGAGMRVDRLEDELERLDGQGRSPTLLYTVPTHQNPTGVSLSVDRRHRLAELAEEHDLLVLEDNPYGLLDFEGNVWPSLRALIPERVIYVGTVSKTFAPAARTGWVAAPRPIRRRLVLLREAADLCQSNLTQMIMETWFTTQPWREQIKRFRLVYRERAETMLAALATEMPGGVTWTRPQGGLYVWMTVPEGIDTGDLLAKALDHRVAYVPGRGFYADGSPGQDRAARQLRLCYSHPEPERIRAGVVRLGELLHEELELVRAVYGSGEPPDPPPAGGRPDTAAPPPV